jgi:hypothetical protein
MDPAIMNYLQSQRANQPGQNPQGNAPYNPFDTGIKRAIESAQESLGSTDKQQEKALRRSLLTFANNMGQQPKQRGFFNNFGSASRAMAPAIMDYDQSEDQALSQNQDMANQILAYQAAEEAKQNALEHQAWQRGHAENQLGEQRRYHDMMNAYQQQKLNNSRPQALENNLGSNFAGRFTPIETNVEITSYTKDKRALGSVLQEISELEKNYKKFREDYKGNAIDPMSPYAGIANPTKDFFGKFTASKSLRKETADRKTLDSQLNKFVVSSERALKGGGVMGPKLIELFKEQGIYPDLKTDTPEVFESKLDMLKHELNNAYKASNLSLQYKLRIDPYEVNDFESAMGNSTQPQENNSGPFSPINGVSALDENNSFPPALDNGGQTGTIAMKNAKGEIYHIPANDAQEAMNDGLTPVQQAYSTRD